MDRQSTKSQHKGKIRFTATPENMIAQEQMLIRKIEFAQIKKQIEVLATFLPDEILKLRHPELPTQNFEYVGVLLFADMSGFTQLTEKYNKIGKGGIYRLTATLNAYIGAIVEVLYFYGGDVLKFSGDAFLALWKVMPDEPLYEILHCVVVCALVVQQTLGQFDTEVNVQLRVKLAISCGNLVFSTFGDPACKYYAIIGDPVNDVKSAEKCSSSGEVVIAPEAWAHMLQERYDITVAEKGNIKVWKVFYKPNEVSKKLYYAQKQFDVVKLIDMHINQRQRLHAMKNFDSNLTDSKITEEFVRSLPPRTQVKQAARIWSVNDLKPLIIKTVQTQVDESQPVEYLTEMREITIQFINIVPTTYDNAVVLNALDEVFKLIYRIVSDLLGVINKVCLFDKDIMALVLFGLRGVNHETESQNALRSAHKIRTMASLVPGIKSVSVGVTNGFVYCGVVGHPLRREYTVIGSAVNKAARIMVSYPNKVTCDHKTFKRAKLSSFYFRLEHVVKLKGIEDAGNIFQYNENFETSAQAVDVEKPLIGRQAEYNFMVNMSFEPAKFKGLYGICFLGPAHIGKTRLLEAAMQALGRLNVFCLAFVRLDSSSTIPYMCISHLYREIYDQLTTINGDFSTLTSLPMMLCDFSEEMQYVDEDIALRKYRILNYFRDIVALTAKYKTLLFIDNVQYIDLQSWEILEMTLEEGNIRLFMTGNFEEKKWDIKFKLSMNEYIKLYEMSKMSSKYLPALACQFLGATGIPKSLVQMLALSCDGRPGYVKCCLLRLINNGSLELKLINAKECDFNSFVFPTEELEARHNDVIPIIELSEKSKRTSDELTLAAISLDLFDSFNPYQQLVIKTGAVLGEVFTRTLLIVALKYPAEEVLNKVLQHLFEEDVLECGSRHLYAKDTEYSTISCTCYFEEDYFRDKKAFPKYAYCKILHFRNKSIRDVAYDLLPGNQRKELHLLCTDVLENMINKCPNCLADPINNFYNIEKFKEVMHYCTTPNDPYNATAGTLGDYESIKDCIRVSLRNISNQWSPSTQNMFEKVIYSIRPYYDPKLCNCLEILSRCFQDLIYHSERAFHLGKRIFFTMMYGCLLNIMQDYVQAIKYLTEARELCLEAKPGKLLVSETFRRVLVGRIQVGLVNACLELRQLKSARNHLAIALRQYNIPSVALSYRHCSWLISRPLLLHRGIKAVRPKMTKNALFRSDMGICLAYCAKLFTLEGHWELAKIASARSLYLLTSVNKFVPILFDVFCNAIDIYRYCNDYHTCEKLQKYMIKEIQLNYSNNLSYNFLSLNLILNTTFEIRAVSGDICGAIRIGYKVLDIALKLSSNLRDYKAISWLSLLLMYNFRIKECADVCRILKSNTMGDYYQTNTIMYYTFTLMLYMQSGFSTESFDIIHNFAKMRLTVKTKFSWEENQLVALLHLYFLRIGKTQMAEDWRCSFSFNTINLKREVVFKTLLFVIEAKIYSYIRSIRAKSVNAAIEEKVITNMLSLLKEQTTKYYRIFYPSYLCFAAWVARLNNKKRKSERILKEVIRVCEKQNNYLYKCFALQLKNHWNGGFSFPHEKRPSPGINLASSYTFLEWAQFLSPYPLE